MVANPEVVNSRCSLTQRSLTPGFTLIAATHVWKQKNFSSRAENHGKFRTPGLAPREAWMQRMRFYIFDHYNGGCDVLSSRPFRGYICTVILGGCGVPTNVGSSAECHTNRGIQFLISNFAAKMRCLISVCRHFGVCTW